MGGNLNKEKKKVKKLRKSKLGKMLCKLSTV